MNNLIKSAIHQIREEKFSVILLLLGFALAFIFGIKSCLKEKRVRLNPEVILGKVVGTESCYKNGKCLNIEYLYKSVYYSKSVRVTYELYNYCQQNNDCHGMEVKVLIEANKPEYSIVEWESLLKDSTNLVKVKN